MAEAALSCAHQATLILLNDPSKLACFSSRGSLVDPRVRASNEHIHIVRAPRAGGRPGCPSHPSKLARYLFRDGGWLISHCARPRNVTRGIRDERDVGDGLSGLSCLSHLSGWPDRKPHQKNQRDQTDRTDWTAHPLRQLALPKISVPRYPATCSCSVDFCESSSDCVPEECHESHPGLLWAFSTVDG